MQGYHPKRALGRWKAAGTRTGQVVHWMNYLVPALARVICKEKGWDGFTFTGPGGLRSCVWIDFVHDGKSVFSLEVNGPDLNTGTLRVTDHTKNSNLYNKGTIGEINGMNYSTVVIDPSWTADQVLAYGHPAEDEDSIINCKVWKVPV